MKNLHIFPLRVGMFVDLCLAGWWCHAAFELGKSVLLRELNNWPATVACLVVLTFYGVLRLRMVALAWSDKPRQEMLWDQLFAKFKAHACLPFFSHQLFTWSCQPCLLLAIIIAGVFFQLAAKDCVSLCVWLTGDHILAERISSALPLNPSPQPAFNTRLAFSSDLAVKSTFNPAAEITAVQEVYGSQSWQLENHYEALAAELLENSYIRYAANSEDAFAKREKAAVYASKAYAIALARGDESAMLSALGLMASIELDNQRYTNALMIFTRAKEILKDYPETTKSTEHEDCGHLCAAAKSAGYPQMFEKYSTLSNGRFTAKDYVRYVDASSVALTLPCLAVLLILYELRTNLLVAIYARRWQKELHKSKDSAKSLELLECLTALHLYRGNLEQAGACSRLALKHAEQTA